MTINEPLWLLTMIHSDNSWQFGWISKLLTLKGSAYKGVLGSSSSDKEFVYKPKQKIELCHFLLSCQTQHKTVKVIVLFANLRNILYCKKSKKNATAQVEKLFNYAHVNLPLRIKIQFAHHINQKTAKLRSYKNCNYLSEPNL